MARYTYFKSIGINILIVFYQIGINKLYDIRYLTILQDVYREKVEQSTESKCR